MQFSEIYEHFRRFLRTDSCGPVLGHFQLVRQPKGRNTSMMKCLSALSIFCLAACFSSQMQQQESSWAFSTTASAIASDALNEDQPSVDDFVKQRMQDMRIPGLSLAVVKDGKVVKASGYGLANLETDAPATPDTVYKAASLSKPFIAAAILLLVQEGKLSLDDNVSTYLDASPESWKEISVRHLLTHTSGIVRDPTDYHPYNQQPITDVIKSVYAAPLVFQPGNKWLYSNVGYYALAEIITTVSGKPWDQFIAERLFAPALMTSTRTTTVTDIVPHRAVGYQLRDNRIVNAENWIAVRPSGAFLSTVLDLAKWDALLDSGSPLTPSSRKLMCTRVLLNDKTSANYGFGWYVDSFLGRTRIHHDGQFPGFRSDYERFEDDKLTVILLANSDEAGLESLAIKIAGFYASALVTPPFTITADVPAQAVAKNTPLTVKITAKDDGKAAPDSLVEMEIWDAFGKTVYTQHQANQSFAAGETKTFTFSWTPTNPGKYSINVGAYGPKWTPSFAWKPGAAAITVN
jgi:CubicO group peptidase (beta-lactamase class C family)